MRDGSFTTDGPFKYSSLWDGCCLAYAPLLGPTGLNVIDYSGNGQTLPITGVTANNAWLQDSSGMWGYRSNGAGDYAKLAGVASLFNFSRGASLAGWVYMPTTGDQTAFGFGDNLKNTFSVMLYHNDYYYSFCDDGTNQIQNYNVGTPFGWNHFALTFSPNKFTAWLNGQVFATNSSPAVASITGSFALGNNNAQGVNGTVGTMFDDVRVYSRPLSSDELNLLYSNGNGRGIAYTPLYGLTF
jgi:hypothetical protein